MQSIIINAFSLLEFLEKAQEALINGYRFDFENNDNVPQRFGNQYSAYMRKEESAPVDQEPATVVQESRPGRKPKQA